jgi:hypothetical protein
MKHFRLFASKSEDFENFRFPDPLLPPLDWGRKSKIFEVLRFDPKRSRMFSYDVKTHFRPILLYICWVLVDFFFKKPRKITKNRFFLSGRQLPEGLHLSKPQNSCFSPMVYPYKVFSGHKSSFWWRCTHFPWFSLLKPCTKGPFFKVDFLIGNCIFDAIFFSIWFLIV